MPERARHQRFARGERFLPFAVGEYDARLGGLRAIMDAMGVEAAVLTSARAVAYYSGFLHCEFGQPYALVVTASEDVTVSAGDGAPPLRLRCHGDNITYTDWQGDTLWRAILPVSRPGRVIGYEGDHLTLVRAERLKSALKPVGLIDIAPALMRQQMRKSAVEIEVIRRAAAVAVAGGHAIRDAVRPGAREVDIALAGRDAMEREIAARFPEDEFHQTRVRFQSGPNTEGPDNPATARVLQGGDILAFDAFAMLSGYRAALGRTLFLGDVDPAGLEPWEAVLAARDFGMSLLKPGADCAEIATKIGGFLEGRRPPQSRIVGLGIADHSSGCEAGPEPEADDTTILEPGMVVVIEPMLTIPAGHPGAGGYRMRDTLVITREGNETFTGFSGGPEFNVIG